MGKRVETIGRYELTGELGRGSMGVVHRAHDPVMSRDVAIKSILMPHGLDDGRTDEYQERFVREARAAGRLSHPGIVTIYDFDRGDDGLPFIAMEFVEGPTLHELICHEGALKPSWAIDVAATLANALDSAHEMGIVHRDLKPANVLVRAADGAAKITDFGVARMSRSDLTQAGVTYGSPAYIAPECLRGQRADGRSDLFALGVILYEMLSGERPFDGDSFAAVCHAICSEAPRPITEQAGDLTPAFNTFFAKALAKDPERRFQNGAEFTEALEALARNQIEYAEGGATLRPVVEAPEPPRIDPDTPDAAERRRAAMGRTGELFAYDSPHPAATVVRFPVPSGGESTAGRALDHANPTATMRVSGAVRVRAAQAGGETAVVSTPTPVPAPVAADDGDPAEPGRQLDRVLAATVALVRQQPAIAGAIGGAVALLVLVLVAIVSGGSDEDGTRAAARNDAPTHAAAATTRPDPSASLSAGPTGGDASAGTEPTMPALLEDGGGAIFGSSDPGDMTAAPNPNDAGTPAITSAGEAPIETTGDPTRPLAERDHRNDPAPARPRAAERTKRDPPESVAANRVRNEPSPASRPAAAEPPAEIPATATAPATIAEPVDPIAHADPADTGEALPAGSVPLTIDLRSAVKDGLLVVEIDDVEVYSAELAAESRGFRRAMRKAIGRVETSTNDTIHVPAGERRIVVRIVNNAKDTEYSTALDVLIEPDGPRNLRINAGRMIGRRLSVTLVD